MTLSRRIVPALLALLFPVLAHSQEWLVTKVSEKTTLELAQGHSFSDDTVLFFANVFMVEETPTGNDLINLWYEEDKPETAVETTIPTETPYVFGISTSVSFDPTGRKGVMTHIDGGMLKSQLTMNGGQTWTERVISPNIEWGETYLGTVPGGALLMAYNFEFARMTMYYLLWNSMQWTSLGQLPPQLVYAGIYGGPRITMDTDEHKEDFALAWAEHSEVEGLIYYIQLFHYLNLTALTPKVRLPFTFRNDLVTEVQIARGTRDKVGGVGIDASNNRLFFHVDFSKNPAAVVTHNLGTAPQEIVGGVAIRSAGDSFYLATATPFGDIQVLQAFFRELQLLFRTFPLIENAYPPGRESVPLSLSTFGDRMSRELGVHFAGYSLDEARFTGCVDGRTRLCSTGHRFDVEVDWRDPQGNTGSGRAVPLTRDTGYFWFFNRENIEIVIKVLDACIVNQRYWVFAGGLTNVEATITVRDRLTGSVKTYQSSQGTAFQPIQDTAAFAGCGIGKTAAPDEIVPVDISSLLEEVMPQAGNCVPSADVLCVNDNRFRVTTSWRAPNGATGQGHAIKLTDDSGYFWFFTEDNVEIVVKVLNACNPFQRQWVFEAGLTNVEVTTTVMDTATGAVNTYLNPIDRAFLPVQDTNAFSSCP